MKKNYLINIRDQNIKEILDILSTENRYIIPYNSEKKKSIYKLSKKIVPFRDKIIIAFDKKTYNTVIAKDKTLKIKKYRKNSYLFEL